MTKWTRSKPKCPKCGSKLSSWGYSIGLGDKVGILKMCCSNDNCECGENGDAYFTIPYQDIRYFDVQKLVVIDEVYETRYDCCIVPG